MVDFAGWSLPVQYSGVLDEHRAVRTAAGLFDVSHMGELRVKGPRAAAFLQYATPNDVDKLKPGRAHYSALLTDDGTYVDDLLVYRLSDDEFLLVVNAANVDKDLAHLESLAGGKSDGVEIVNESDSFALLALQGPLASGILQPFVAKALDTLKYYRFRKTRIADKHVLLSRTGYTGEDGFELYVKPEDAPEFWQLLLEAGVDSGLVPAGLGARDTLRLEAAMALYGYELDDQTNPLEAGLTWTVKMDCGPFHGKDALMATRKASQKKKLVGFEVLGRGIGRSGYSVLAEGHQVGVVTSGTFSPTLEKAVGMAYVPPNLASLDQEIAIAVRGRELPARIVDLPFYRRS